MATTRRRRRRGATPRSAATVWLAVAALLVGGPTLYLGVRNFAEGRYLSGTVRAPGGSDLREAWDAYGPGAFSGDSPIHLLLAGVGLSLVVFAVALLRARVLGTPLDYGVVGRTAAVILGVASGVALVLLIANWTSGVPLHNFRPTGADGPLYAAWCILPLLVLGAITYLEVAAARHRRTRTTPAAEPPV